MDQSSTPRAFVVRRSEIDPGVEYVPPGNAVEARLAEILQQILQIDRIGRNDSFFELGGDSLQAITMFMKVEQAFGVTLPAATIIGHPTIGQLAELVDRASSRVSKHIVTLRSDGATPPLFLIHDGSGMLFFYRALLERLSAERKIYGLQFPIEAEDPIEVPSISALAETYVDAILGLQPKGPYLLAGYSYGGYVAYEIAVLLRQRGHDVGLLVIIDTPVPGNMLTKPQLLLRKLARHLNIMSDLRPSQWASHVLRAIRRDLTRAAKANAPSAPQIGLAPGAPSLAQKLDALFRAGIAHYRPPDYDGSMKLVRSSAERWSRRCLGWSDVVRQDVEIFDVPGHHWDAMTEPAVALVAAYLDGWLRDIEGGQQA